MADNSTLPATGDVIASDDIAGVKYQIVKAAYGALDSATLISPVNPMPASPPNATASGTLSASDAVVAAPIGDGTLVSGASTASSIVYVAVPDGMSSWTLMLKNYTSGTVYTEASNNTTNGTDGDWVEVKGRRTGTAPGVESVSYAMVANGYYRGNTGGFKAVRARLIGATGVTVRWDVSSGTGAVFLNSGLVASGSVIGKVGIDQTTPGVTNAVQVNDVSASGTLSAAAQTVPLSMNGDSGAAAQIGGTWVGTITFEGTLDSVTWFAINAVSASTSTPQTTTTVNGLYRLTPGGLSAIRANMTAFTSGSATVLLRASDGAGGTFANQILPTKNTDGTSSQAIKAASTAAVAADAAAVVSLSPNSPTPAGTNVIGSLAANQTVNISQTNGVAPLMGNGVSGTGSQRVNIASDNSALPAAGQGAVGSAVPAGATLHGLRAATANPTNATAGNMVAGMADKAGRAVVAVGQVRELIGVQQTSVAVVTADQPIVAAGGAGVFNDISQLIITTAGAAAQTITIKDAAAGTTRLVLNYPNAASAPGAPMAINFNPPLPAAAANTAWVVTQSAATACNYTVVFAKNL